MTPAEQELNIALCEWRGWKKRDQGWYHQECPVFLNELPNHISGIAALGHVNEAENGLSIDQHSDFVELLGRPVWTDDFGQNGKPDWPELWKIAHSSAKRRTVALLTVVNPEFIKTWRTKYPNE